MKRLVIATPLEGKPDTATVHYSYHTAVRVLERSGAVILEADIGFAYDVGRARSSVVAHALKRDGWDWVLWWDEDVIVPDPSIVLRMIALAEREKLDVIGAPYPRKRYPLEYPCELMPDDMAKGQPTVLAGGFAEVAYLPFGFTLTSAACLREMSDRYAEETACVTEAGDSVPMLFAQMFADSPRGRVYLSEDNSFCHRWRAINGHLFLYLAEGSLGHAGGHVFGGRVQVCPTNTPDSGS